MKKTKSVSLRGALATKQSIHNDEITAVTAFPRKDQESEQNSGQ